MRQITDREIENIINNVPSKKIKYFLNLICDEQEVWGLYDDGWALAGDSKSPLFPIWPAKEFAAQCATNAWEKFKPSCIPIDDFIDELIPRIVQVK